MKRDGEEKEGKEEKQKVEGRELLRCCCDPYAIVRGEGAPGPFLPCALMRALTAFYSAIQSPNRTPHLRTPNFSPSYILPLSPSSSLRGIIKICCLLELRNIFTREIYKFLF